MHVHGHELNPQLLIERFDNRQIFDNRPKGVNHQSYYLEMNRPTRRIGGFKLK
jgi:hypothetical protein